MKKKNYREKAAFSSMLAGFLSIIILASPTPHIYRNATSGIS
jgi:hypothetical protein